MTANLQNRILFRGGNLKFLRAMNSESVDLIATDPPFNKGRDFHAMPDSLAAGAKFQDRWSWEGDVHESWTDQVTDDYPKLMEAIEAARYAHSDGMGAYMRFMAVRLPAYASGAQADRPDLSALQPDCKPLSQGSHGCDIRVAATQESDHLAAQQQPQYCQSLCQRFRSHPVSHKVQ